MGTGADCETISLGDIFDFEPTVVAKERAPAFIPSTCCEHDGCNYSVQPERGKFTFITIDIDHGDHSLMQVQDTTAITLSLASGQAFLNKPLPEGAFTAWFCNPEDDRDELDR